MRIAAIESFPTSERGGSEKAFFEVLSRLKRLGHEIVVFYILEGDLISRYNSEGITCIQITGVNIQSYLKVRQYSNLIKSALKINSINPDLIYINQLLHAPLAILCKFLKKTKVVSHLRLPRLGDSLQLNSAGKKIDLLIAVNPKIKIQYSNLFRKSKILVIQDAIVIPKKLKEEKEHKSRRVICLGRISPEKGLDSVIEVWKRISNEKLKLDIIGPVYSQEEKEYKSKLLQKIINYDLEELIHILPPVANPLDTISTYDLLIFPSSWQEPFGRTIPEAILAGVPVLSRNVGITSEILAPAADTLIFNNDEELKNKILSFYKEDLKFNIRDLQNHIITEYDVEKNVRHVENAMLALL